MVHTHWLFDSQVQVKKYDQLNIWFSNLHIFYFATLKDFLEALFIYPVIYLQKNVHSIIFVYSCSYSMCNHLNTKCSYFCRSEILHLFYSAIQLHWKTCKKSCLFILLLHYSVMEEVDVIGLFWNNIRVGRWELACGFLQILREESQKNYVSLLIAIALQPEKYWLVVEGLLSKNWFEKEQCLNGSPIH